MTELVTLSRASKALGVTTKTLRNWDAAGKIRVERTVGKHRRIPQSEIDRLSGTLQTEKQTITLAYCRCSTQKQKENLERQIGRVLEYCYKNKWQVELYKDIGSGLNENRREFKKLLKRVSRGDVSRVVLEYKDRIARYGFGTFKSYCDSYHVEIVLIEDNQKKEFEQELVDDIISLVTSYSARLYGRRGGRPKKCK
jgi:putative resolvase